MSLIGILMTTLQAEVRSNMHNSNAEPIPPQTNSKLSQREIVSDLKVVSGYNPQQTVEYELEGEDLAIQEADVLMLGTMTAPQTRAADIVGNVLDVDMNEIMSEQEDITPAEAKFMRLVKEVSENLTSESKREMLANLVNAKPLLQEVLTEIRQNTGEWLQPNKVTIFVRDIGIAIEAFSRKAGVELDGFLEYFQTKWLIKTTIFSLSVYKFYQAIFDWLLSQESELSPRRNFKNPDAIKILADNSVIIQFIIQKNSTTDENQEFVVSLRKLSMIWDQISDSIQHVIAKAESRPTDKNDKTCV